MTTQPNHSDDELDALKLAVIDPLRNFITLSNIVFTDYHGQLQGDDPEFDKFCKHQDEAEKELYAAIQAYVQQEVQAAMLRQRAYDERTVVLKGRIEELTRLHRLGGCGYNLELDELIDERIAALKAKEATHD